MKHNIKNISIPYIHNHSKIHKFLFTEKMGQVEKECKLSKHGHKIRNEYKIKYENIKRIHRCTTKIICTFWITRQPYICKLKGKI